MHRSSARLVAFACASAVSAACRVTLVEEAERPVAQPQAADAAVAPLALLSEASRASASGEAGRLLELARERSPSLSEARARVDGARADLELGESALRPRLALDAGLTHADSPSLYLFKAIDAHELGSTVDFNHPGSFDSTEAGLTLRWNLWNGGRDTLAREGARDALAAREAELAAARNALCETVLAAWIELGSARELEAGDRARVETLAADREHVERRVAAGATPRAELCSLDVRLVEARTRLDSTQFASRSARVALERLCGPAARDTRGAEAETNLPELPASLELARSEALSARAELAALERALAAQRKALEAEQRSGSPSLDLEGRLYATELDLDPRLNDTNSSLTLGLHWDLADGGARRARRSAAESALRALVERRRDAEEGILQEVELAWLALEHARSLRALAEQGLAAAEETHALVEAQYREGGATISRFLEVEADRAAARSSLARARLGVVRAATRLSAALGRWSR